MILQNNFDLEKVRPIIDLHTCLQGEGKLTGVPHILIRLSGCKLRCQFKDTICDTPYSSYKPESGKYTLQNVLDLIHQNPQIKYVMVTGGEPTNHLLFLNDLCDFLKLHNKFVTIETCGSGAIKTNADLISLSPKLSNSTPKLSLQINQETIDRHEKFRKNYKAMSNLISWHPDYYLKCVVSEEKDLEEIKELQQILNVPGDKIYLMPEGIESDQITSKHLWLIDYCIKYGYNLCDRMHVRYFGNKRDA